MDKEFKNGFQTEENLNEAKKHLADALNHYIDYRIDGVMEDRKRRVSISTISDILANSTDQRSSLLQTRLLLAPSPIESLEPSEDHGFEAWFDRLRAHEEWMLNYKDWFESVKENEDE